MEKIVLYSSSRAKSSPLNHITVDPKGKRIACGTTDAKILLISAKTGKPQRALSGHGTIISSLAFIDNGTHILSTSWDKTTRIWQCADGVQKKDVLKHSSEFKVMAVNHETSKGAVGTRDGTVKIFSIDKLKCLRNLLAHKLDISGLAFTSNGSQLVTASWDGSVKLWDMGSLELVKNLLRQKKRVRSIALTPDDSFIHVGLHSGVIRSVSLGNIRNRYEKYAHSDIVSALAVSPSGEYLISGSWDRTIKLWNLSEKKLMTTVKLETGVTSLAWAVKGDRFYSTDFSGSLTCWQPPIISDSTST